MSDPDSIEEELSKLKREHAEALQDYAELVEHVKQLLNDKLDANSDDASTASTLDYLKQKADEFKRRTSSSRERISGDIDKLEEKVVKNPLLTVAVSFGIGYLLARLLGFGGGRR